MTVRTWFRIQRATAFEGHSSLFGRDGVEMYFRRSPEVLAFVPSRGPLSQGYQVTTFVDVWALTEQIVGPEGFEPSPRLLSPRWDEFTWNGNSLKKDIRSLLQ